MELRSVLATSRLSGRDLFLKTNSVCDEEMSQAFLSEDWWRWGRMLLFGRCWAMAEFSKSKVALHCGLGEESRGSALFSAYNYIQIDGNANTMGNFSEQDLTGFHDINIAWHLAEEEVGTSKGFATTLGFKFSIQFNFSHLPYNIPLLKVQCFVTFLNWNELLWAVNMKYQPLIAHCAALGVGVTSDWQKAVLFEHSVTYCLLLYENTELRYELHREIGIFVFNYY